MKQHSVPENIMDVEFKLFGSLSAKQFGYIIAGGFIALFFFYFFKALNVLLLGWIFAFLSVILGLSLALIRINEQPFEIWLGNFIAAMFTSQKRVWKKEKKAPDSLSNKKIEAHKQVMPKLMPRVQIQKTVTQSVQKDTSTPMPHHPFKDISKAASDEKKMQQSTVTPTKINGSELQPQQLAGQPVSGQVQFIPGTAQKYMTMTTNQTPNRPVNFNVNNQQTNNQNITPIQDSNIKNTQSDVSNPGVSATNIQSSPSIPSKSEDTMNKKTYINKANKFNDIVPDKAVTIEQNKQQDTSKFHAIPKESNQLEEENKALRQKVAQFSEEKVNLEKEIDRNKDMYTKLQNQNIEIGEQLKQLQSQIQQMQSAPQEEKQALKQVLPANEPRISQKEIQDERTGILSPKVYQGPSLSKKPNVISGIVRTKDGKLLPGVVVIVKNDKSRPVRAMRTNSLGQFITTTSLEDGVYVIELSKEDYSFGRFEVKLAGDVIPTYEFVAY